jgi:putative membrane-bound dehydrogenase-like protein
MTRPHPLRIALFSIIAAVLELAVLRITGDAAAAEIALNGRTFTLPEGFTIELAAAPPLVERPIVADFDEKGRLYIADSSGSNDPVVKQVVERPHRIVRLEDTDGDGRFDHSTVFADKMMFPEGAMWLAGSLYVSAPPSIWKLTDNDGDGVAEQRDEWFQGKTLTGCANDLHGPYAGPDGWIYWAKGAFAEQKYERPGKPPFVTKAAHIFRARPDGSGLEPVMTGGMDNPVDVVFTPGGERIFSTTFMVHPGGGQRDGLIHAIYGGIYGKIHDPIFGASHKWTSPEVMPVLVHLGPAAACGLTTFESDTFGPEYRDNLFACSFNLRIITRHVLTPSGATFATKDEDFLVAKEQDFHPTDVFEDADGSLVVVDTGGWYKLCCPTAQLPKPDVLGAVYRVRRAGAPKVDDPRGLKLDWDKPAATELAGRLHDPRPAVRRRAIAALAALKESANPALSKALQPGMASGGREFVSLEGRGPAARIDAVWAACRIDHEGARALVRQALSDPNEQVRQAACHAVSVTRDKEAVPILLTFFLSKSRSAQNRRAAAEALGRLEDPSAVPTLLAAAGEPADRALEHSLRYALIEIGDAESTAAGLQSPNPLIRRAALVALDQMDGGKIGPELVTADLASTDPQTRATAAWIVGRHPDWANALVGFLRKRLFDPKLTDADRAELSVQLARFAARSAPVRELIAEALLGTDHERSTQRTVLRAIAQSGVKDVPKTWVDGLTAMLMTFDPAIAPDAVAAAAVLPLKRDRAENLTETLIGLGGNTMTPVPLRLDALAAVPGGLSQVSKEQLDLLRAQLDPENAVAQRTTAAGILAKAKLNSEQLLALTESIKTAGPLEMDKLLTAFESSHDDTVGLKLVAALKGSAALGSLRIDMLKPRLDKYGSIVRQQAEELYATINVDAAKQKARLEALLPTLADGDIRRGQSVFNGTKAACLSCHAVGYVGGKIGPDLTAIGKVRTERDLLESILYPSLSFVRSYESLAVATKEGKVITGLLKKDSADELVLVVAANEEAHIPRDDVEEVRPGSVSVMPAGLDQQLSRQELADLLAFLKSRK